jgi:hypothetical protein
MKAALETPAPGTYNPKNENFKPVVEKPVHSKQEKRPHLSKSLITSPLTQNEVSDNKKSAMTSSVVISGAGGAHDIKAYMLTPSNVSPVAK